MEWRNREGTRKVFLCSWRDWIQMWVGLIGRTLCCMRNKYMYSFWNSGILVSEPLHRLMWNIFQKCCGIRFYILKWTGIFQGTQVHIHIFPKILLFYLFLRHGNAEKRKEECEDRERKNEFLPMPPMWF